jgi:hypothetical protein
MMIVNKRKIILYVIFAGYLLTAFHSNGYHHPDEHFQLIEFAGLKGGWNTGDNLHSKAIQYDNGNLYADIYNFDQDDGRCLLRKIDIHTGKHIHTFLNAGEYCKGDKPFLADYRYNYVFKTNGNNPVKFVKYLSNYNTHR